MRKKINKISIVIPVFNSENILSDTIKRTLNFLNSSRLVNDYEIILIDDRSPDATWEIIESFCKIDKKIKGIRLLKNYGQHTAVYCGLMGISGDYAVTMDDDLQNPPEEIEKLILKALEGFDAVFGRFERKMHSGIRKFGTKLVGIINKKIFGKPDNLILSNFRILRKDLVARMLQYRTMSPYIPGLVLMYGEHFANVEVEHHAREIGKSNYTYYKIAELISRILFNYSSYPLRFISFFGVGMSFIAFLTGSFNIVVALTKGINVPGWTSLIVLLSFFNGLVLLILGLIGEYMARLINESSNSPVYYTTKEINLN